ncbi:hypothetical protein QYM36_008947 [Artemia franciscana]|uniref:RRM domain-containing protein n=1 Tax=Artemia franciscana TaxID=6661 RepID=A0AA88HUW8_ARTSF|nr:hypothetical protein QYM36_008947 [Artemia franciscana]
MAPTRKVKDAREIISGRKHTGFKDARDRLVHLSKKKDARLVLQEKRLNKSFGGDTHITKSGRMAVVQKQGKIEIRTLKNQLQGNKNTARMPRTLASLNDSNDRYDEPLQPRNTKADAFAAATGLRQKSSPIVNEPYRKINQILETRRNEDVYATRLQTRQNQSLATKHEMDYQDQLLQYQQSRGTVYKPAYMDLEAAKRSKRLPERVPVATASSSDVRSRLEVLSSDGHRVQVSNLGRDVTEADIKELFGDIGPLKMAKMYRPGTAEIVFVRRSDAVQAIEMYNNRQLDGLPMKCRLVHLDDPDMDVVAEDDYVNRIAAVRYHSVSCRELEL